jgi:hypothetical protein
MLKWGWRRVCFPQWLSFLVCFIIETGEVLQIAATTTTHASTSKLEPRRSRGEIWSTHTRLPGILKFKYIYPSGQGALLLTFNCSGSGV